MAAGSCSFGGAYVGVGEEGEKTQGCRHSDRRKVPLLGDHWPAAALV